MENERSVDIKQIFVMKDRNNTRFLTRIRRDLVLNE